jgi:hypothetical protein
MESDSFYGSSWRQVGPPRHQRSRRHGGLRDFGLASVFGSGLEYRPLTIASREESMASVSVSFLQALTQELSGIPAAPSDLAIAATQLGLQLDGLARLDHLDLLAVEPATVLVPSSETPHVAR